MNEKAISLGLISTNFATPHGLDKDDHYTTAYELAKLSDYALQNKTFAQIVNTSNYTVDINGRAKNLRNTNELLGYFDGVYGVKTGFTNGANRCLVVACKRGNLDVICVVLGCDTKKNRSTDSINLLNYIFNNFSVINIKDIITKSFDEWYLSNINSFNINKGIYSDLELYLNEDQISFDSISVNNSALNTINTPISFSQYYDAPLQANTVIGKLDVTIDNIHYFSVEILNRNPILKKNIFYYLNFFTKNYFDFCIDF